jgi:DNA-binding transcriptional regulator YdaS (Cro superfamily)
MKPAAYWASLTPNGKRALARQTGLAYSTLSAVLAGGKVVGGMAARKIEQKTLGAVRAADLRPDLFG